MRCIRMKPISAIGISDNGRYFVDRQGSPIFWLGDTLWELFRCFTPETALPILRNRQAKGFNIILIMLTGVDHVHVNPELGKPFVNIRGDAPWVNGDPLNPDERYFQHIDTMIRLGEQTGQIFVVGIYHQWHRDLITLSKARPWARWIAERYRDVPNLIWSMYPRAEPDYVPVCRELAAGLQEGDQGTHLISVHPDPSVASSSFMHTEPWLAFNMIQTCIDYEQIYDTVTADYNRIPVKPVIMAEGGYEGVEFGRLQTAYEIRQQAYWTQFAGGYHVYGHNDAWINPERWQEWIDAPGAQDMQRFREIITAIDDWWDFVPDPCLIMAEASSEGQPTVAGRATDGRWILAYLSEPGTVTLRLTDAVSGSRYRVEVINPATGEKLPAMEYFPQVAHTVTTPVGWQDTLIYIEASP
ncbi:MAG: DUF4038 domain-containing protein [Anaerolineales bacterium]|nr:MAG: DUF4038 domain-containing protein [Anaerolineales bacterium]